MLRDLKGSEVLVFNFAYSFWQIDHQMIQTSNIFFSCGLDLFVACRKMRDKYSDLSTS